MGKVVAKKVIVRKPGHLYYVDAKGNVCEAKMARGGRRKKKKVAKKKPAKRKPTRKKPAKKKPAKRKPAKKKRR